MLTKLTIRNFKRLKEAEIPLGQAVVFIGPNNSGKTTALQALALWEIGLRAWLAERGGKASPEKRPGVTINRRDLIALPVPAANLLWSDLHVRGGSKDRKTQNIRMEVIVEGQTDGKPWSCGFEFDYTSNEALICRPVRQEGYADKPVNEAVFTKVPLALLNAEGRMRVCYLPPMSGLAAVEPKVEQGRIDVLLGEGQTAQVLRNLCHTAFRSPPPAWAEICEQMKSLFGLSLAEPEYVEQRGEIVLRYEERGNTERGTTLDISSAGRGAQQTLLLLAYIAANPGAILLLDEPDAHLEILRQRQIYNKLVELTSRRGSQIIAASHSEVVLDEAAGRHTVIAFIGKPHELTGGRTGHALKALRDIGFENYYQAEQTGWVLFLEDSTDLPILRALAQKLGHEAVGFLEKPYVCYLGTNVPQMARNHFFGLREAKPDLVGVALFDRLEKELQPHDDLIELMWRKREIENYLCKREVLLAFAASSGDENEPLFEQALRPERVKVMEEEIAKLTNALQLFGKGSPWSDDIKATDEFLDPLFKNYSQQLGINLCLRKSQYAILAEFLEKKNIDPEVVEKLDQIVRVAKRAKPRE